VVSRGEAEPHYFRRDAMPRSRRRTYIYGYKNNPTDVAASITAVSQQQAEFKLGLRKGHAYVKEALEEGYLHLMRIKDVPPPRPKRDKAAERLKASNEKFERMQAAGQVWWND
jgi:hypothetical protein